jgi:SAM-dependent methyltransferase
LNWKIRYSKILFNTPELFDPASSVVEVGCGPAGISQFLNRNVIGVEPHPVVPRNENLEIVEGSILALPFSNDSVDYVLCVDVLEHLAAGLRENAIRELLRVAKKKVIISCPCHLWAKAGELELKQMFQNAQIDVPDWLQEHLEFGLPLVQDILNPIVATGHEFEVAGNETMLQHYAGIALDWLYPMAQGLNTRLHPKSVLQPPIIGNEWDLYYSFTFTIKKAYPDTRTLGAGAPAKAQSAWYSPARYFQRKPSSQPFPPEARPVVPGQALYAVYHKVFPSSHLGPIIPIYTGELADSHAKTGVTDICVNTAGLPNRRWSELSAIYKIWKEGPKTPVVGFCHYRRLFDFTDDHDTQSNDSSLARETNVTAADLKNGARKIYDADIIASVRDGTKIIVAKPHDTNGSIFEHYCELHSTNHYLELITQCAAARDKLLPFFLEQFSDHLLFANNLFILSWAMFSELCGFWFDLLGSFAAKFPNAPSDAYQQRDVAFLSERVFDAWIRYRQKCGSEIVQLPILFVTEEAN